MKQYRRRIENLERTIDDTIRVIVKRGNEPDQVIVIRKNAPPHQSFNRNPGESANAFLSRAGCRPASSK